MIIEIINMDGGPGSGNFGHEGVPGSVGGSAPSGTMSGESTEGMSVEQMTSKISEHESDGNKCTITTKIGDNERSTTFEYSSINKMWNP